MSWFLIALVGPVLWAIVNHIDKYLLSDRFEGSNIGALMIFSTLFSVFIFPIFFFLDRDIFSLSMLNIFIMLSVGFLTTFAYYLYMKALDEEEVSIVIPITQMIPVFGFILSYIILDEKLSMLQVIGGVLVMVGSLIITVDLDIEENIKVKTKILVLMLTYSFVVALYSTLFKFSTVIDNFYVASFWEHVGLFLCGLFIFIFVKTYRQEFLHLIKFNGKKVFFLNLGSETLTMLGNVTANFALMLAPVSLVLLLTVTQPVFVFIIAVIMSIFFSTLFNEKLTKKHLIQKIISIIIIVIGSALIS